MDIERIGRNPAGGEQPRSRASQISVHNGTVYFAATPDRPFDPGASIGVQTRQCWPVSRNAWLWPEATSRGY